MKYLLSALLISFSSLTLATECVEDESSELSQIASYVDGQEKNPM